MGEVASEILGTHNSRDKVGHKAYHLEASINFSISLFTQGTAFLLQ